MSAPAHEATPTTLLGGRDGICRWFGGPYDPESRSYRTPQVDGLGVVRRARPKREDNADFYLGQPASGAVSGSWMWVHVDSGSVVRVATAGHFGGMREVRAAVVLHVFLRSVTE